MAKFIVTDKPHLYPTKTVRKQYDHLKAKRDMVGVPGTNYSFTQQEKEALLATERELLSRLPV